MDWIIVILLISLGGYFLLKRNANQEEFAYITIRLFNDEWRNPGTLPRSWYSQGLTVGQTAHDPSGNNIAEVISIGGYTISDDEKQIIDIGLKARVNHNKKTQTYMLGYQTLLIGRVLDLSVNKFVIRGLVTYIGDDPMQYNNTEIEAKLLAAEPWETEAIREGTEVIDLFGTAIGTINSVVVTDATAYQISDESGTPLLFPTSNDKRKEITMKIALRSYMLKGSPYFIDGTALKIGNYLWLETERSRLKKVIISNIVLNK